MAGESLPLDSVIERLLAVKQARPGTCVPIGDKEAVALIAGAEEGVLRQPVLLQLQVRVICTSMHTNGAPVAARLSRCARCSCHRW